MGLELIPVLGSQLAGDMVINQVVGCHYFCQACAYLPKQRASLPSSQYQVVLLVDSSMCVCEQLAQSRYLTMQWLGVRPVTSPSRVQYLYSTKPPMA